MTHTPLYTQAGDQESGLAQLKKALAMFWQTGGFDSYESINAHHALALFLQSYPVSHSLVTCHPTHVYASHSVH